jgi:hypothetical protein
MNFREPVAAVSESVGQFGLFEKFVDATGRRIVASALYFGKKTEIHCIAHAA